jgi:hypothetical protein
MYLLRRRKMDETDRFQRVRTVFAATLSNLPIGLGTDVHEHLFTLPSPQLRRG